MDEFEKHLVTLFEDSKKEYDRLGKILSANKYGESDMDCDEDWTAFFSAEGEVIAIRNILHDYRKFKSKTK